MSMTPVRVSSGILGRKRGIQTVRWSQFRKTVPAHHLSVGRGRDHATAYHGNLIHRALVLFDIDGTLVRRAGPHHREALVYAIRRITGLETTTEGIPVQGMLDPDIITVMMRRAGVPLARVRESLPE